MLNWLWDMLIVSNDYVKNTQNNIPILRDIYKVLSYKVDINVTHENVIKINNNI